MQRILILSDGRPGHFNLSEGIALAAERLQPTAIERRTVRRGRWPGAVLAALVNAGMPPRTILARVYGIDAASLPRADLVVSAGAETLAANVAVARHLGAPNVFYGSLRRFRPRDFSLVLTSYARQATAPNRVMTLKPAAFDPDTIPPVRWRGGPLAGARLGLVVGGPAPGIGYRRADWDMLDALIETLAVRAGGGLSLSNSRRTPDEVGDRLAVLARRLPQRIGRFIDVRTPGAARLVELLGEVDALLVTADSSSMISEAVWARRPVVALVPTGAKLTVDEESYRAHLEAQGWAASVHFGSSTADAVETALAGLTPPRESPLVALSRLLADTIPALRADGRG